MAEPSSVSRRAARLWPALNALEQVTDTVTATAVRADATGQHPDLMTSGSWHRPARAGPQRPGWPAPRGLPRPDSDDVRLLANRIGDVRRALTGERAA